MRTITEKEANELFGDLVPEEYAAYEGEKTYFEAPGMAQLDWKVVERGKEYVDAIKNQLKHHGIKDMPKDLLDMIDCYVGRTFGLEVVQVKFDGDAIVWFLHPRPSPF
jgi:hypothetical protein